MSTAMPLRRLGKSGAIVSALGLGCMAMTPIYSASPADDAESIRTIHRALDLGIDFIDTADGYGLGKNEELIGRALAGHHRERAFVATKFGNVHAADGKQLGIDGSARYVKQACEASLRRLKMDTIDLLYLHRVDAGTPIEESAGAMGELVTAGKVRFIGFSEATPQTLRRAHATYPVAALQSEYSLWTRDVETDGVLDVVRELGIGFVAYSPLGRGFLTGRFRSAADLAAGDSRLRQPRFSGENLTANLRLADAVATIAARKGCTSAQFALAWLMRHEDVIPIPGTKTVRHLDDDAGAIAVTLEDRDLSEIDAVFVPGAVAGERYAPERMARLRG
jgi:aryl-alcohol dehydrogenase-like predicted oxidoreductase